VLWSRRDFARALAATTVWTGLPPLAVQVIGQESNAGTDSRVPTIYSTDLFHPPDDPDDDVDLATLFALRELDVRAVILDLGMQQRAKPGEIPLRQMMSLTGRQVSFATGLWHPLKYPSDKALAQPFLTGVELILTALREAKDRVTIVMTGSARDVMAAFNRDETLFREKVARIYFNDGNSGGGELQWNPGLDPQAYLRLMTADLPVYWCPAFAGTATVETFMAGKLPTLQHQVYWKFVQSDIYDVVSKPLQNFFLYALGDKSPRVEDPLAYLEREPDVALRERVWRETRNMWSTASLYHAAGRELYRRGDSWTALAAPRQGFERMPLYEFVPATVSIDRDLRSTLKVDQSGGQFRVFRLLDLQNYERAMTTSLKALLAEMPSQTGAKK
jgi:hypothetical protein